MNQRILSRIREDGPMPFDEYMDLCLYDPDDGFFSRGMVRPGIGADFVTSPEVSPWFGRLIGRWASSMASGPDAVLIEIGSGSGALLGPAVGECGDRFAHVYAVEVSEAARDATYERVPGVEVIHAIEELPSGGEAVIVINEVLDNLPAKLVERRDGAWWEYHVDARDGRLVLEPAPASDGVSDWCVSHLGAAPDGVLFAAQRGLGAWLTDIIGRFDRVRACIVDYAAGTETLASRRREQVVRTFRRQRPGFDALAEPGLSDITVDVNTDVVQRIADRNGWTLTMTNQASFLEGLGARTLIEEFTAESHRHAREGDVMAQLAARSEVTDISALLDRNGFGGFCVMQIDAFT